MIFRYTGIKRIVWTYCIIDCDQNNEIIRSFSKINNKFSRSLWVGKDISTVIIKKKDTNQNVNFYEVSTIEDKIFNVDSFETSTGIIIYVAKEINSSEGLYFKANYDTLSIKYAGETYRDDFMKILDKKHPNYFWKQNKGYPTKQHRIGIAKFGTTKHHRKSFQLLP